MSVRRVLTAAAAAVLGGFGLATPAAAHARSDAVDAYTLTPGRLMGTVAALVALAAAEGGPGTGYGIVGGFAALAIGLIATVLASLALARSRATRPTQP
jgi:hypothetical protein